MHSHEPSGTVAPGSFLTLHYRLSGADGTPFVDTFDGPPATLTLGTGELAPAMEAKLLRMHAGDAASFEFDAGEAFGARSDALVQRVARSAVQAMAADESFAVGDVVRFPTPDGGASFAGIVRAVDERSLLFDFNHPLAGKPVRFDVHVIGVL